MPLSRNPAAYRDIAQVLDAARAAAGGTIQQPDYKAAIRWRARAYMLRSILFKLSEAQCAPYGLAPSTPYDGMILRFTDTKGRRSDLPHTISIEFEEIVAPVLKNAAGEVISLEIVPKAKDAFEEAALKFASGLED